jgi:CheY-like chemotaxis protein
LTRARPPEVDSTGRSQFPIPAGHKTKEQPFNCVPPIIITASDAVQLEQKSRRTGARILLHKPFLDDQLRAAVEAAVVFD